MDFVQKKNKKENTCIYSKKSENSRIRNAVPNIIPRMLQKSTANNVFGKKANTKHTISSKTEHLPIQCCGHGERGIVRPGDADFIGPHQKSWRLSPTGQGAHLVERVNVKGRPELTMYDKSTTPRYYPYNTPENAGQAHIRLHQATKAAGIKLSSDANSEMSSSQMLNTYQTAYDSNELTHIKGDLRTPKSEHVYGTNLSPGPAFRLLRELAEEGKF
ncbi:MAG: hypothetical protein K2N61_09520 [Lachnospiraceae bacterium]|nr:hypothetical protein [Lachnospiraceae bacterium]